MGCRQRAPRRFGLRLLCYATVLLTAGIVAAADAGQEDAQQQEVALLVRLKPVVDLRQPRQLATGVPSYVDAMPEGVRTKLFVLGARRVASAGSRGFYSVRAALSPTWASRDSLQAAIEALGLDVYEDEKLQISMTPNDPLWPRNSAAMTQISADLAWDQTQGSTAIKVCVIDSGLSYQHPDLAPNCPEQLVYDVVANTIAGPNNDLAGHGTHVSGTIGAVGNNGVGVAGVNWAVNLIGCKFLDADGKGQVSDAVECLRWCREQGARITSNSWGSERGADLRSIPGLTQEMQAAQDANMLFVAAAGNEGLNLDVENTGPGESPLPSVINVGAVDVNDVRPSFSNYGRSSVHLYAPGVGIVSTYPGNQYASMDGTSMACPHVTGTAALLWSTMPSASYALIRQAILASVDVVPGASESITGGRLNVWKALQALSSGSLPPLTDTLSPTAPPPPMPPTPPGLQTDPSGDVPTPPVADSPPASQDPANGTCVDVAEASSCASWQLSGYCGGPYVYGGQLIDLLCPVTCGTCGVCVDYLPECSDWAAQGFCPLLSPQGFSVGNITCRASCGTCGGSIGISDVSAATLDLSGVWTTNTTGSDDLYLAVNLEEGSGSGVWLRNPPQTLTLQHSGGEEWLVTDIAGQVFHLQALPGEAGGAVAESLVAGLGGDAATWSRKDQSGVQEISTEATNAGGAVTRGATDPQAVTAKATASTVGRKPPAPLASLFEFKPDVFEPAPQL